MTISSYLRRKVLPKLTATLGQWLLKAILMSCRIEVKGLTPFLELAQKGNCILAMWHRRLAPMADLLVKFGPSLPFVAVISKSRDGALLSSLILAKKLKVAEVAHDKRHQALRQVLSHLKAKDVVVITPDGPKGPPYQVKPGIAFLSQKANAPVIPICWHACKCWQLSTWDKMLFPKPFSKIELILGAPIYPTQDSPLEPLMAQIQQAIAQIDPPNEARNNIQA